MAYRINRLGKQIKNSEPSSLFLVLPRRAIFMLFMITSLLSACSGEQKLSQEQLQGPTMGTYYKVTIVQAQLFDTESLENLEAEISKLLKHLNRVFSTYDEQSEISRINRSPAAEPIALSTEFEFVLKESIHIANLSDGAFDPTLGPAIRLWGFDKDGAISNAPNAETLAQIKAGIGYDLLTLEKTKLTKGHSNTELNLSAIAKGYAVDKLHELLTSKGYNNFLLDIGGELRAQGVNVDKLAWQVAIERPEVTGGVHSVISLSDSAIATSGDYRNYTLIDGKKYSHTIDSKSLTPKLSRLTSASVLHQSTMTADALATTLMALGSDKALQFAIDNELSCFLLIRTDGEGLDEDYQVQTTGKFASVMQ